MKALTLWNPWAMLVAIGAKKIETRGWATKHKGPLAIHAAKHFNTPRCAWEEPFKSELAKAGMFTEYPGGKFGFSLRHNGSVIAIAESVTCLKVISLHSLNGVPKLAKLEDGREVTGNELAFGDYTPGRYAWRLERIRPIVPVPAKGMQKLWEWDVAWVEPRGTCSTCAKSVNGYPPIGDWECKACLNAQGLPCWVRK